MRIKKSFKRILSLLAALIVLSCTTVSAFADTVVNSKNSRRITISSDRVITIPSNVSAGYETYTLPEALPDGISSRGHFCSFLAFDGDKSNLIAIASSKELKFSISLTQYIDDYGHPYYPASFVGAEPSQIEYYVLGVDNEWHVLATAPTSFKLGMFISSYDDIVSGGRMWIEHTSYAQGSKGNGKGFFFGGNTIENGGIIDNIVVGFRGAVSGLASGAVSAFDKIAIDGDGLTDFAVWAIVFTGIAMAVGIIWAVVRKVG